METCRVKINENINLRNPIWREKDLVKKFPFAITPRIEFKFYISLSVNQSGVKFTAAITLTK
jgi:hypothetical protein